MMFGPNTNLDKRNMIKPDHNFMAGKYDVISYFLVFTILRASWIPDSENKP